MKKEDNNLIKAQRKFNTIQNKEWAGDKIRYIITQTHKKR